MANFGKIIPSVWRIDNLFDALRFDEIVLTKDENGQLIIKTGYIWRDDGCLEKMKG